VITAREIPEGTESPAGKNQAKDRCKELAKVSVIYLVQNKGEHPETEPQKTKSKNEKE